MTPRSKRYLAKKLNAASLAGAVRYMRRLADSSKPIPEHLLSPPWPGAAKMIDAYFRDNLLVARRPIVNNAPFTFIDLTEQILDTNGSVSKIHDKTHR